MDVSNNFNKFYEHFRSTELWEAMKNTHENSPYHREFSVAVHTQMLLDWYTVRIYSHRDDRQRLFTLVGCLFHDVGKPKAEIIKHSEERGEYRAYHGHELLSARIWTDYALSNPDLLDLTLIDISDIAFMIEHHVPFALKDKKKRKALKDSFLTRMGHEGHQAFLDLLECDQNGRESDDKEKKLADVAAWLIEWNQV